MDLISGTLLWYASFHPRFLKLNIELKYHSWSTVKHRTLWWKWSAGLGLELTSGFRNCEAWNNSFKLKDFSPSFTQSLTDKLIHSFFFSQIFIENLLFGRHHESETYNLIRGKDRHAIKSKGDSSTKGFRRHSRRNELRKYSRMQDSPQKLILNLWLISFLALSINKLAIKMKYFIPTAYLWQPHKIVELYWNSPFRNNCY